MTDRPSARSKLRAAAYGAVGCTVRGLIHLAALVALVLLWSGGHRRLFWTLLTVLVVEVLLAAAAGQAVKAEHEGGGGAAAGGWRESTAIAWLTWLAVAANLAVTVWAYLTILGVGL